MNVVWGVSYVAVKVALGHAPITERGLQPFAVIAARFWLAVLCLAPFLGRGGAATMAGTVRTGLATGIALLLGYSLQTLGIRETTASMGGFLAGLIPLLVAIGGWVLFREPVRAQAVVGLALGIGGVVLLCAGGADQTDGAPPANSWRGILLQIGSSISYAVHILMISRLSPRGGALAFCMWQLIAVATGATVLAGLLGQTTPAFAADLWTPPLLGSVLYLGVFATAIGIAVQSKVQPRIRPTHVAILFATQPLFVALAGALLLGETMTAQQFAGGGLIVVGVLATSLAR
jgi:drug/metabolite transporter (DMT)-like permease